MRVLSGDSLFLLDSTALDVLPTKISMELLAAMPRQVTAPIDCRERNLVRRCSKRSSDSVVTSSNKPKIESSKQLTLRF